MSRLAIIVEELVTNLYDHAGLTPNDIFEFELSATDANISLIIIDRGTAFDPKVSPLAEEIPARGGGAGLRLLRQWASRTDYESCATHNRLLVLLPRSPQG